MTGIHLQLSGYFLWKKRLSSKNPDFGADEVDFIVKICYIMWYPECTLKGGKTNDGSILFSDN